MSLNELFEASAKNVMKLIDTHCHLAHARLRYDLPGVIERSRAAGVVAVICAAANLRESQDAANLARQYEEIFFTAGIHPHDAKEAPPDYLPALEELARKTKNVAIGEIGLDYHYSFSPPPVQRRIFAEQLELAAKLGKMVFIHTREALADTMAILHDSPVDGRKVIFHSFTENPERAGQVLQFGATISFSGIVTFKKADELRHTAATVPDDRILIETDGPFLSPEPMRRMKTNEPANVLHVAACLAAVRGSSTERIAELTTANARRLLQLEPSSL